MGGFFFFSFTSFILFMELNITFDYILFMFSDVQPSFNLYCICFYIVTQNTTQDLFELLERVQSSRLDDQRCVLPPYFTQVKRIYVTKDLNSHDLYIWI